jgi:hypothetical protein
LADSQVKCERRIDVANKLVCLVAVLAVLAFLFTGLAAAQSPAPTETIHQQGLTGTGSSHGRSQTPPSTIFYGGDGNPLNPEADGLWANNSSAFGLSGSVYSPFIIPKSTKWKLAGLFTNVEYFPTAPSVDNASWAIVSVDKSTTPPLATTICSGVDAPTLTDTGRLYFGLYEEFTTAVTVAGCTLSGGSNKGGTEYWESITVQTGAGGIFQLAYESNVPDVPPPFSIGTPEPTDDSYFYGPQFGAPVFINANTQGPFHVFSAGIVATVANK